MNQVAHLCSDGGKLGSEFPLASVHVAPLCVVFVAWGEGPGFCALCAVRDTSPVGFGSNKCHRENLKTNREPFQVAQDKQKPDLIKSKTSNLFQDLINRITMFLQHLYSYNVAVEYSDTILANEIFATI